MMKLYSVQLCNTWIFPVLYPFTNICQKPNVAKILLGPCFFCLCTFAYGRVRRHIGEMCSGAENTQQKKCPRDVFFCRVLSVFSDPTLADFFRFRPYTAIHHIWMFRSSLFCIKWAFSHSIQRTFEIACHQHQTTSCYWPAFGSEWHKRVWCYRPISRMLC